MQCLAVFSYGSPKLEAMESAFLSWRVAMATAVSEAAAYIALHGASGAAHSAAPALVQFLNKIAARFQIVISDKLAAEAVPVAGAVTSSLINAAFTDHFNRVAEFHFGILRLEQTLGAEMVQAAYRQAVERVRRRPEKTRSRMSVRRGTAASGACGKSLIPRGPPCSPPSAAGCGGGRSTDVDPVLQVSAVFHHRVDQGGRWP